MDTNYNFPSPGDRKPNRSGCFLVVLILGGVALRYAPLPPQIGSALPPAVRKWRGTASGTPTPQARTGRPAPTAVPSVNSPAKNPIAKPTVRAPSLAAAPSELTPSNLPLRLPGPPLVRIVKDERIRGLEAKIAKYPVFALYRDLAKRHLEMGNTEAAAAVDRAQAALYRRKGLSDAAQILEKSASQNQTTVRIFAARAGAKTPFTGAPLEPRQGCYLGAFIDRDDALTNRFTGDNWQTHHLPSEFEARVGRRHASVFTYVKWGNFPRQWLEMCKREGVIPHIAWEPSNLNEVQDDAYLRSCGQFLRQLDWPVFVRFAGEMNGDWTPWHGNPTLYRQKFAQVHRVLHRYSSKVATIWCVNAIPSDNIAPYYPGDANCDWVGVNLYSTPFTDNDRTRQAFRESPLTLLDPIYRRYSARKPIAICEYGASHQSAVDGVVRTSFAVEKMSLLYGALPLLYPRVKLIDWYSSNNLIHAREGRKLNNYRLTQQPLIQQTYKQLTVSPHFLTSPERTSSPLAAPPQELSSKERVRRGERLWLWATSSNARPAVFVVVGGKVIYAGRRFGKHVIDLEKLPAKATSLAVLVYNEKGRCLLRREIGVV